MGPVPIGVVVLLSTARCVAVNATLEMLARPVSDLTTIRGTHVQFGSAELGSAFARALLGEIVTVETDNPPILGMGQGQWRLHFLPFVVDDIRGAAVLFEDMTEHRLTAAAFRAAEQRFRLLVDSAADGIVIFRAQILLYVNPEAVRLFGFHSPDELVGRSLNELVESPHRANFESQLSDVESGTGTGLFESVFLRANGDTFPAECRASHARVDEMGAGYLFFRDISLRKRMQLRQENARRVESLAKLSTSIGHELRAYALELRSWVSRVRLDSPDSSELVGELQGLADLMSARAGTLSLAQTSPESTATCRLEELIARVCTRLESVTSSIQNGRGENVTPPERHHDLLVDLEPIQSPVRGDPSSIEAGITTLVEAALKGRTQESPICIRGSRVSVAERAGAPMGYRLTISEGSTKQARAARQQVDARVSPCVAAFTAWEQARDLELLGAFAVLQAQGCWVEVKMGSAGTHCFEVELGLDSGRTLSSEFDTVPDATGASPNTGIATTDTSPDTERSHLAGDQFVAERAAVPVLICDDEARLVALTAGLLREFGFEVLTVRSGAEAIRTVAECPVDIVILDVNLPGEDAYDIVTQLRSQSDVSIILSSGYTEEDIEPSLLQNEAVKAFLAKPYGVETLVETIDQVRQRSRQPASREGSCGE